MDCYCFIFFLGRFISFLCLLIVWGYYNYLSPFCIVCESVCFWARLCKTESCECVKHPCACVRACVRSLVHSCMCWILVHAKSQCWTSVAVLYRHSDMPVMDEIVRDFKVAQSQPQSWGRQVQVYLTSLLQHLILLIHNVSLFVAQFTSTTHSPDPTEFVWDKLSWKVFTRNSTCVSAWVWVCTKTQGPQR